MQGFTFFQPLKILQCAEMKLYLSSGWLPHQEVFFDMLFPGRDIRTPIRTAFLAHALDQYDPETRDARTSSTLKKLSALGCASELVNLYELGDDGLDGLAGFDMVYAGGGKSDALLAAMRTVGFKNLFAVCPYITYCGRSAGAVVVGTERRDTEGLQDPNIPLKTYSDCLGWLPMVIIPHADEPDAKVGVAKAREEYMGREDVVYLRDDQSILYTKGCLALFNSFSTES
jgi:peptidase E